MSRWSLAAAMWRAVWPSSSFLEFTSLGHFFMNCSKPLKVMYMYVYIIILMNLPSITVAIKPLLCLLRIIIIVQNIDEYIDVVEYTDVLLCMETCYGSAEII